jgi:hypothetical protein
MPGVAVLESGNYDLKISTGFSTDGIKLNDPIKAILAGYATLVIRTNLLTNPNFEVNATGWGGTGAASVSRVTTDAYIGTASAQVVLTNPGNGAGLQNFGNAPIRVKVSPSTTYTISAYVKQTAGASMAVDIDTFYYNSAQTSISSSDGPNTTLTANWQRITRTITTPALTEFMGISIGITGAAVGSFTYLVDAILIEQSASALPYFDGTYADPYTGYTLTNQQWNSTPNASTSKTVWGLTTSFVNSDYVLDGTTDFADVLNSVLNINVRRGRRDVGDQFSAGTMTFTIQDVDGVFNPFDENSPYYDTPQSKPGLAPLRAVQLIRYSSTNVPESLFSGYVVNYDYNFALGGLDTVTVYCADQFYLLAQTFLDTFNVDPETSGERIETVLDLPEVDFPAGARDIATGTVDLGSVGAYTVPEGTNVLQYLTQINETAEFGRLFMSRAGVLTFQNRIGNTLSAPVAEFKDDGTGYKFDGVGISFEADSVVNRAVVSGLSGSSHTATDPASIATYFIQTVSITNSLLHDAGQIQDAAEYLLNPEPEPRYTSVATKYLMLTTAQKDTLATIDIGDTISIEKTFPSGTGTTQLAQELSVEGIEHRLDFSTGHSVLYSTAPTTIVFELLLDNAIYGVLDALNVLG